jgi:predicted DNA-binding ribbon-helix-helix protein
VIENENVERFAAALARAVFDLWSKVPQAVLRGHKTDRDEKPAHAIGAGFFMTTTNGRPSAMPGKRVQFDAETWQALDLLARDRMMDFQELADEAFRDLLRKHGRPSDLRSALRQSAGEGAVIHKLPAKKLSGKRKPVDTKGTK